MLQEEEGTEVAMTRQAPSWPPPGIAITRPAGFMGKISRGKGPGGRPVEWPPRNADTNTTDQINNAPNMTTTYPSSFKLREAPDANAPAKVVMSQPAFKITEPIKRLGDEKWPPKGFGEPAQNEVREFARPSKMSKDYEKFFSQNALPHNYAAYRPPPGTQHIAVSGDENGVGEE